MILALRAIHNITDACRLARPKIQIVRLIVDFNTRMDVSQTVYPDLSALSQHPNASVVDKLRRSTIAVWMVQAESVFIPTERLMHLVVSTCRFKNTLGVDFLNCSQTHPND